MRNLPIALGVAAVVIMAAYWFATGGLPGREPPAWLTARAIAHRGEWSEDTARPENSLAAFDQAARNGHAVELDVQLSADGHVVVFHDDDLDRMTDESGPVVDTPLAELEDINLLQGAETIPTLAEALATVAGRVPVFVEIKNRGEVGVLEDSVAQEILDYEGDAAVMSFNPFSLARVAEAAPEIPRGQLSSALKDEGLAFYEVFLLRNMLMNWKSRPDFIAYDLQELPSAATKFQQWRGRPLVGWVAEDRRQRTAAEEFCEAVICDPEALLTAK